MFRTEALGILWKVAAVATVGIFGYWLVSCIQHAHIAELYNVAGRF